MDPLIITATANISGVYPEAIAPRTWEEKSEEAGKCIDAGASIIHIHADPVDAPWDKLTEGIRKTADCILQHGQARGPIEERKSVLDKHPDMVSIDLSNHDIHYEPDGRDVYRMHPRNELIEMVELCSKYDVKPEFELWNTGHLWNLKFLIEENESKNWTATPYWVSYVTGFAGGAWSPPTLENYLYMRRMLPENVKLNVVVKCRSRDEHIRLLPAAIANGDNIRVGAEDNPYLIGGDEMRETHEIVKWAVELSEHLGRKVATVDQAREMLNIG